MEASASASPEMKVHPYREPNMQITVLCIDCGEVQRHPNHRCLECAGLGVKEDCSYDQFACPWCHGAGYVTSKEPEPTSTDVPSGISESDERVFRAVIAHLEYIAAGRKKVLAVHKLNEDEQKAMSLAVKKLRAEGVDA
jgi:DnaJ-class molecular chaperone